MNRVSTAVSQVAGYSYQRGPTGNLANVVELNGRTVNWTYDGINRLTSESITSDPSKNNGSVSYGLDPVGNRTSASSSLNGIPSGNWSFNADDEVSSESYDANGNVIASGGKSFAYDSQNHLISMNGGAVQILYDGDGNRVAKSANGIVTRYLVDDLNPTGYAQVIEELSGAGVVERQYTYGLQRISQNQPINNTWTISFYGYDGGGNLRQLTGASGAVTDTYEYDAYGNHWASSGTTPNNMFYRGEEYDSDLGLLYLRARYMNPLTGRFVSRDPDDGVPTDPISLHKYLYGDADPVDLSDPWGLAAAPVLPVPEPPPAPQKPNRVRLDYLIIIGTISLTAHYALPPLRNQVNCIFEAEGGGLRAVSQYLGAPQDLLVDWASCSAISGARKRAHQDPLQGPFPQPNPGPNPAQPNGCNPCPPLSCYWEQQGTSQGNHGCPGNVHYHWYEYNQSPDCKCHPDRKDACAPPANSQLCGPGAKWPL
ncbi:RHS repeat domain-containing protein [Occallatibacter riparius]|uniref:RHS repeat-associated core domain-containing protein n=1 Tax=Occallatibacter riparius TaxID=1002689 RepID=A0A9J7BZ41_9BACT|nr:RHS repeat-associated core domain-containing protein [Occallatibacter riparius]UWZ86822.1 hypothetical protein MOP44_12940 [Occallatibacter riparius]